MTHHLEDGDRSAQEHGHGRPWLVMLAPVPAAVLAGFGLDRMSLWWDETDTAALVSQSWGGLIDQIGSGIGSETGQPLYYLLLRAWVGLAGDSEVALRLPSLVALLITAVIVGRIVLESGARVQVATAVAAVYPVLPFSLWYASEARPYALVQMLAAGMTLAVLRAGRGNLPLRQLAIITGLGVATIWVWVATAPAVVLAWSLGAHRTTSRRSMPSVLALAVSGAALAAPPALLTLRSLRQVAHPVGRNPIAELAYSAYELVAGRTVGPSVTELRSSLAAADFAVHWLGLLIAGALGLGALLLGLRALTRIPRRHALVLVVFVMWATVLAILGAISSFPLLGRHISFALPVVVAIVALGADGADRRVRHLVGGTTIALAICSLAGFWFVDAYAKEDLRAAAAIAGECTGAQVVWAANPNGADYYLPDVPVQEVPLSQVRALPTSIETELVVFVLNGSHYDPRGETSATLADTRDDYRSLSLAGVYVVGPLRCIGEVGTLTKE